jgi:hypothetical protein
MSTTRRTRRLTAGLLATASVIGVPSLTHAATSTDDEDVTVTVVVDGDPSHRSCWCHR